MDFLLTFLFLGIVAITFVVVGRVMYENRDLRDTLRRNEKERKDVIDFLNHFCRRLARVTAIDDAMHVVAHYLQDVLGAESLAIFTVDPEAPEGKGRLRGTTVAGMFPTFQRTSEIVLSKPKYRQEHLRCEYIEDGGGILGRAAVQRESILIRDTSQHPNQEEIPRRVHALMVVPMFLEHRFVGIACAVNCRDEGRSFSEEDLRMFENLAYQAALAHNLVGIYSERSKQERILKELQLGREIQESLLPSKMPDWGDYRFAEFSRAALEVGGDYYDFIPIDENRLMIVVADATGKGVPACMLMAMCRSFVWSLSEHYAGLERFLEGMNRRLYRGTDQAHFLTMAVVVIDKQTHVCECGCAGHTPLLLRMADGITRTIRPAGPALGLLPSELGVEFDTVSFCFLPGTNMLLFTDGLTEALNAQGEEFGLARLRELWQENTLSPEEMASLIIGEIEDFSQGTPQFDDQTMLLVTSPVPGGTQGSDR